MTGNPLVIAGFVVVGAMAFTALGYVIASFAPTEESANFIVSAVQFPMMFLSGIFFPLQGLPDWLQTVASFLPAHVPRATRCARRWSAACPSPRSSSTPWCWVAGCSSAW